MRLKTLHIALALLVVIGGCKARRAVTADPSFDDPKGTTEDPGASDAYLSISEGSSHAFGNKNTGTTTEVTLTLVNEGVKDAENIAIGTALTAPFRFKGGTFPGTGGTCVLGTLAAENSCSLVVEYRPTINGTFSNLLVLNYESDGVAKTFSFGMSGSAGAATLTVTGFPTFSFDNTLVGEVNQKTLTVSNTGSLTARFIEDAGELEAPFRYKGDAYPGTGGTCGVELAASTTCTIVLEFAPTSTGDANGFWGIGFLTGGSAGALLLALEGSSGTAILEITDTPLYTYAATFTGATLNRTFTITNTGSFEATEITDLGGLAAPFTYLTSGVYPGTGGTCTDVLDAGDTCTIIVRFSPTLPETATDTIELSYFDGENTQSLELDLSGLGQGAILEADIGTTYDFGLVAKGSVTEATITLENTGNYAAASITITNNLAGPPSVTTPMRYKGNNYPGTGGSCTTSLAAGATCTMVVEYEPGTASGTTLLNQSDTTAIRYNPGSGVNVTLTLTVQGRAGRGLLTFSSGAWGTLVNNSDTERSVTVTNSGTFSTSLMAVNAAMSAPFYFAGGAYPGSGGVAGTCGTGLSQGGSCILRLRFNPTITGVYADSLVLGYSDGTIATTASLPLSGTSALGVLTITDHPSYDFGSVSYNEDFVSRTFTVQNTGGLAVSAMGQAGLAAPFTRTGGTCGATLASGATCTHILRFTPTAAGAASDTIDITYNDGEGVQTLSLDLDGTGLNVAPVADDQSPSVPRNDPGQTITFTGSDENGTAITYEVLTLPSNGTLDVPTGDIVGASVVYEPDPGYTGPDSFTFRARDGLLDSPAATVSITVTP